MSDSELDDLINDISNITITDSLVNTVTMASLTAAKEIAHTIKQFSGKSEHLEFFINSVDKFYNRYFLGTNDESLKEFVFASICSKLIDDAGDYILCRPDLVSWPSIRDALRLKFGDRINRHVLAQQLNFLARNKNESVLDFLERLKILKTKIALKINSDASLSIPTKIALVEQTELNAVSVLIANSPSELRTILMYKNPVTLDDANSDVINHMLIEQQLSARFQPRQNNSSNMAHHFKAPKPVFQANQTFTNPMNHYQPQFASGSNTFYPNFNNFSAKPSFPSQPINIQSRQVQHHFPTAREVFGPPKNVFSKENSHKPKEPPVPMSTSSRIPSQFTRNGTIRSSRHFPNFQRHPIINEVTHIENSYDASENIDYAENQPQNYPECHDYFAYENVQECTGPEFDTSSNSQLTYMPQTECYENYQQSNKSENENFPIVQKNTSPP